MRVADRLNAAEAALERGAAGEAVRLYESLRSVRPDAAAVLLGLGRALTAAGRYADAEAIYRDLHDRGIEPIRVHAGRARILLRKGDLEGAERMYRNVMQADSGNLEARLGLAEIKHRLGLDRTAREQADNIVLDHPESGEARALKRRIHESLRPRVSLEPRRATDTGGMRVDMGSAALTFMAEPQTSIRIAYEGRAAEFRCTDAGRCGGVAGPPPVNEVVTASTQALTAGLTSRLIQPLGFHARLGAVREEGFDGDARIVAVGGGHVDWQVGPRFALGADGGREALRDTAPLIDRGVRLDTVDFGLEHRLHHDWRLFGQAGYGSYSDGNARLGAVAALEWRLTRGRPRVAATLEARYRAFNDDRDNGYFDPLRYESGRLSVSVADERRGGRIFWSVLGTLGRQSFDHDPGTRLEADPDPAIREVRALAGVGFGTRGALEVFYERTGDALHSATGFTATRAGLALRLRG